MKILVDDQVILELSDIQKKVICNDICSDILDDDLKRRINYILIHKYEQCLKRLKDAWIPVLAQRYEALPTNDDAIAQLIFSQPDYKCRKMRDEESQLSQQSSE